MRIVSTYYADFYPFDAFIKFTKEAFTNDPADLREGDVLLVWGGQDIPPQYYGKQRSLASGASNPPSRRDAIEWAMMQRAIELKIPIIGICRGAQMLCAAAGGTLMQHITGHGGEHRVLTSTGEYLKTNSMHHQMMVPGNVAHEVLAEIPLTELRSHVYIDEDRKVDHHQEPEMIWFNDINGCAVQWHPEFMEKHCPATKFIFNELEKRL